MRHTTIFYEIGGKEYSLKELAAKYQIPMHTLYYRLRKGWSIPEALDLESSPKTKGRKRRFLVDGVNLTLNEISEKYSIPYAVLHLRINYGWSIERAVNTKVCNKIQNRLYSLDGKEDLTIKQVTTRFNLPYSTVYYEIQKYGTPLSSQRLEKKSRKRSAHRRQ